ncbi:integrase catalytic domain-containing protein [Trichonephila clavipes]|nr:integrase catalytic domain-containing protein [Trichonephila clavipes]
MYPEILTLQTYNRVVVLLGKCLSLGGGKDLCGCEKALNIDLLEKLMGNWRKNRFGVAFIFERWKKSVDKTLFTCAVYRAIHLELINSLTSDAFLLALKCLIARRGRPRTIYCDNGTNFRGAFNDQSKWNWSKIVEETRTPKILWKFISPTAPWWGGWWERLVGTVKDLLKRTLGRSVLKYDELYTVLCDCESIINCRP